MIFPSSLPDLDTPARKQVDVVMHRAAGPGFGKSDVLGKAEGASPFAELLNNDGQRPTVVIDSKSDLVANMVCVPAQGHAHEDDVFLGLLPFFHIYGMVLKEQIVGNLAAASLPQQEQCSVADPGAITW